MKKFDIRSAYPEEIYEFMEKMGYPKYRAQQIINDLAKGYSFDEMAVLPKKLRSELRENCILEKAVIRDKQISKIDGTVKYLFSFSDGELIETVLMKYKHGISICISTQAGCRMGCSFCASTKNGLCRNLTAAEMLEQITAVQADSGEMVTSIVLMGIGEPLDNYDNVLRFIRLANSKTNLNIGMRHITLSTCGLVDKINLLAKEKLQITLSVSLHSPNDDIRQELMPIARKYTVAEVIDSCKRYSLATGRRVTYEYAMIDGINDSDSFARDLGMMLKDTLCHVNLIPLNPINEKVYNKSDKNRISAFTKELEKYKIRATVRRRLGSDIDASCGQLRNKER